MPAAAQRSTTPAAHPDGRNLTHGSPSAFVTAVAAAASASTACAVHGRSLEPGCQQVHYLRVPKTGSTLLLHLVVSMQCNVVLHNHDECGLAPGTVSPGLWCQTAMRQELLQHRSAAFGIIREPCSRLLSQLDHLRKHDPHRFGHMALRDLVRWLAQRHQHGKCSRGAAGVACMARSIASVYASMDRAALGCSQWPRCGT